jgi:hypothetical protein
MVENVAAPVARAVIGLEDAAVRAIGLSAVRMTFDRGRRVREAALHRLRLKADIL